jgi:hypothetical protein
MKLHGDGLCRNRVACLDRQAAKKHRRHVRLEQEAAA